MWLATAPERDKHAYIPNFRLRKREHNTFLIIIFTTSIKLNTADTMEVEVKNISKEIHYLLTFRFKENNPFQFYSINTESTQQWNCFQGPPESKREHILMARNAVIRYAILFPFCFQLNYEKKCIPNCWQINVVNRQEQLKRNAVTRYHYFYTI